MTKFLEAYCTLHWKSEPQGKVLATIRDVALEWDQMRVTLDLCGQHKREVDAGKYPLPDLLAAGDPAPAARAMQPVARKRRAERVADRPIRDAAGKFQQPAGTTAELVRTWCRELGIKAENGGRPRLAYESEEGRGNYFPIWLLARWEAEGPAWLAAREPAGAA